MSICIAYKGKLSDPALLPEFLRDMAQKAEAAGWRYKMMSQLLAEGAITCAGLEGITLYPPQSERLNFHFDKEGNLVNLEFWRLLHDSRWEDMVLDALARSAAFIRGEELPGPRRSGKARRARSQSDANLRGMFEEGKFYNWTQTQHAGPKVHMAVCALLRHVMQTYIPGLEVRDDSDYFTEGDETKLEVRFALVERHLAFAHEAVMSVAATNPKSFDDFVNKLETELNKEKEKLH